MRKMSVLDAARKLDANGYDCCRISPRIWVVTFPDGSMDRLFSFELTKMAKEMD